VVFHTLDNENQQQLIQGKNMLCRTMKIKNFNYFPNTQIALFAHPMAIDGRDVNLDTQGKYYKIEWRSYSMQISECTYNYCQNRVTVKKAVMNRMKEFDYWFTVAFVNGDTV
jgi:hypothetical protein